MEGLTYTQQLAAKSKLDFTAVLEMARAGKFKDLTSEQLTGALTPFAQQAQNTDLYATKEDYERNFYRTYNQLAELEDLFGKEKSIAEKSYDVLLAQLEVMQGVLTALQKTKEDALNAAFGTAPYSIPSQITNPPAPAAPAPLSAEEYKSANPDLWGFYQKWAATTSYKQDYGVFAGVGYSDQSWEEFVKLHGSTYGYRGQINFASGGYHEGGWRTVGEQGPELEYTGPSRIFSNKDSKGLLDTSALEKEIKLLREDFKAINTAVAKYTHKTAKVLERWDVDGLPEERVLA